MSSPSSMARDLKRAGAVPGAPSHFPLIQLLHRLRLKFNLRP